MITEGGFGASSIYHLSNISDDLSEIVITSVDCVTLIISDDTTLCGNIIDLWDISNDGQKVLFSTHGEHNDDGSVGHALLIWNVADETQSQIITEGNIVNAAFHPEDDDTLLYISESGLVEYNLVTDDRRILDETLSLTLADGASFSPNAEYLVIGIADLDAEEWNLYLKDLSEYID
jgi:hypothetical protein